MKSKFAMFSKSKSTITATLLTLILGGAGFLGSPAWAAEICGFSSEAAKNAGPQYGGSITFLDGYGAAQQPTSWHQGAGSSWTASIYVEPMYQTLVTNDLTVKGPCGTGESGFYHSAGEILEVMKGQLAERWELPDPKTLIWHLRRGIMWSGTGSHGIKGAGSGGYR